MSAVNAWLPRYVIAVDLGQVADPTAIIVAERSNTPTGRFVRVPGSGERPQMAGDYELIHIERVALNTPYSALPPRLRVIDDRVRHRWSGLAVERHRAVLPFAGAPVSLLIDQTGVGRGVYDYFVAEGLAPIGITIHGGSEAIQVSPSEYRVPKRDLVGAVQVALQNRRLRWSTALPEGAMLKAELANFKARISLTTGHDSYAAGPAEGWREGAHDDLVLATALAVWFGERNANLPVTHVSSYIAPQNDDDDADRYWPAG